MGPVIDRLGAKRVLRAGLVIQALGFGLLPLVSEPWHAYALLAFEGIGSAAFWPSQSTLISRLTPPARLHAAFAQQRVTMNLGVGLGGLDRRPDRERRLADVLHRPVRPRRAHVPRLRRRALVRPRPRHAAAPRGRVRRLVPRGAARPAVPRPVVAELPLRRRGLLAAQPPPAVHQRPQRPERATDRRRLLLQHGHDRARAAPDLPLARGEAPPARARADAGPLGRRVARGGRDRLLARSDGRVRRGHRLRDRVRDRGVPARARAPGARRRARSRTPARSLLRAALDVVGARRRGRAGDRRADPRDRAVCALAARGGGLPRRSRGSDRARAPRPRAASPHPACGTRARRRARRAGARPNAPGRLPRR